MTFGLRREEIERAYDLIKPHIRVTPVVRVAPGDLGLTTTGTTGVAPPIVFKLELMQRAGSFKTRGAFTHMLTRQVPAAGVVAASGGNHGAAVAYAAQQLKLPARIYVPSISSAAKIARIRACGADLCVIGDRYAEALAASQEWAASSGAMEVHAFDHPETLIGQATLGLELEMQAPEVDTVLIGVGGGGLIGGVAGWYAGRTRIIGVEPEGAPTLTVARAAGRPVDAPTGSIAADSLAPLRVGELMFPIAEAYVERVVLVSDAAIQRAQRALWDSLRIVAEPGGSAATAALLDGVYQPAPGERVAVVVSGANTTAVTFPD
jgi:threonine dehydratase